MRLDRACDMQHCHLASPAPGMVRPRPALMKRRAGSQPRGAAHVPDGVAVAILRARAAWGARIHVRGGGWGGSASHLRGGKSASNLEWRRVALRNFKGRCGASAGELRGLGHVRVAGAGRGASGQSETLNKVGGEVCRPPECGLSPSQARKPRPRSLLPAHARSPRRGPRPRPGSSCCPRRTLCRDTCRAWP